MKDKVDRERLLIVDDETDMLEGLRRMLSYELRDVEIIAASNARDALQEARGAQIDTALLDIRMPDMDGLDLLDALRKVDPQLTVIMMTAYGSIEVAVGAIRRGAYDFITKPFDPEHLVRVVKKGFERNRLIRENIDLHQRVVEKGLMDNLVGESPPMLRLRESLRSIARSNYTVLIRGESGTGKELAARAIHGLSKRRRRPMVIVNCPAIPEHLLESELFGHKRGAFTGADLDQTGVFEEAEGSSILLDEIADIPIPVQTKLLRVIQEQEIKPLGVSRTRRVDVRIIASTNQNLEKKIQERTFREDLFYRLNVVNVRTPSLSEIRADIPLLAAHFAQLAGSELGIPPKRFTSRALQDLMNRSWPGNVRELQNFVRRAFIFCSNSVILTEDIAAMEDSTASSTATDGPPKGIESDGIEVYKRAKERVVNGFTLEYVSDLLEKTGGNVTRAAELSGLSRAALQKILRRLDVKSEAYRDE